MKLIPGFVILKFLLILSFHFLTLLKTAAQEDFRVYPYLQNPSPDGITIIWFSNYNISGQLSYREEGRTGSHVITTTPHQVTELAYSQWENEKFFGGSAPTPPFRHRVRLENLRSQTDYEYIVNQSNSTFTSTFSTAPAGNAPIRVIFYADSETEPESVNNFTDWPDPSNGSQRPYLTDQATGYKNNLEVIRTRKPDMVFVAGDLVEAGGEQRDWDEFWRNNTDPDAEKSLGGKIPVLAAPGNHEYFEGPYLDLYNQPGSERAIKKFLSYFELPPNKSGNPAQEGRYYSLRYGPATFIVLDVCNNGTNKSEEDTNFYLLGESDPGGGNAPDISPGSEQYKWLESQLKAAQLGSLFKFIIMHHSPYSSGPHGFPPGETENTDNQSGYPLRKLTGLFMKYGVDAVISGHDEIWERSEIQGTEVKPDNYEETHTIQFYDVGIGGDGLRGPEEFADNQNKVFLGHDDCPEVWRDNVLITGGKHYGHLEVDITAERIDRWKAVFRPVYIFPVYNESVSGYTSFDRRIYDDEVVLSKQFSKTYEGFSRNYPNPFRNQIVIEYYLPGSCQTTVTIYNLLGQKICLIGKRTDVEGLNSVVWDGRDSMGNKAAPGIYFCKIETDSGLSETQRIILSE